ncbi:hypothetical protein MPER_10239 [Moniliophthora perniciosa FA553]|nr:hypothetical protein MPER_10239 [Moniliophthora perniciosa FA553]
MTPEMAFCYEQKVILVNHSRHPEISKYHGKAVWVKMDSDFAPSATLFLLHEACVRAFWCTTGDRPIPLPIVYQDAFLEADTAREEEGDDGDGYRGNGRNDESTEEEDGPTTSRKTLDRNETVGQVPSSGFYTLSWNPVQLQHVISSARQLPTWKQSLVENESWEGTAEENIEKYRTLMISGDDSNPHQASSIAPAD